MAAVIHVVSAVVGRRWRFWAALAVSAVVGGHFGGCGLHWRVQRLLAGVLAGSMFIGGLAGVGGIIVVSVSAIVGDERRLWSASAGSAVVGSRVGGVNVYWRPCRSRRYCHCIGVGSCWRSRRLWAALAGSVAVGGRLGGVNVYRRHCRSRRYYHCISVGSCWRSSAVVGCIVGFSGCWGAYWRGPCLSAALQESAVLSLYRCRQMLATVGGCGLHWRVQWLLAGVLAGSMFIGGIAGVGGIIVVSVSAIVGDERRLWSASAGSAAVGSHIGGVTVYRRHCRSRRCYHCIGVGSCCRSSAVVGCIGGFSGCWRAYWRGQCLSAALHESAVLSLSRCHI